MFRSSSFFITIPRMKIAIPPVDSKENVLPIKYVFYQNSRPATSIISKAGYFEKLNLQPKLHFCKIGACLRGVQSFPAKRRSQVPWYKLLKAQEPCHTTVSAWIRTSTTRTIKLELHALNTEGVGMTFLGNVSLFPQAQFLMNQDLLSDSDSAERSFAPL